MNRKIKILYFHHGGAKGGAPRSLAFLIKKLDKSKYEPYVLICYDAEENKKIFESVGAKVIYRKFMGAWHGSEVSGMSLRILYHNLKNAIPTYFQMFDILKEVNPDIVHLNSTCLFVAAKAIKKYNKNIPIVCHVREPLLDGFWGNILRKENEKYIDEYIAIEQFDADSLKTKKNVNIVYNFVDFNDYNSKIKSDCLRKEFKIKKDEIVLLYLARISKENGAKEMLNNITELMQKNEKFHLCLVGIQNNINSKYQDDVLKLSHKFPTRIHFSEFRKDVPNVIASSDIMIAPFVKPHFARSIIEAAAMGVPSIGSNIGGIKELIKDGKTGLLFNYETFEDFNQKCEKLINDCELRKTMGLEAEKYAIENFDADKNSKRTFDIYKKLLYKN